GPTVHVLDASRSVGVVGSLLSAEKRGPFSREVKEEYVRIRTQHAGREPQSRLLTIADARKHATEMDWAKTSPPRPKVLGITEFADYSLDELANYIDWSPFFATWELRGHYPAILDDKVVGKEARKLLDDAKRLLDVIIRKKAFHAKGVVGLFAA